MTRHLLIFAACFLVGAALTAAVRTIGHDAYKEPQGGHPTAPAAAPAPAPAPEAPSAVPADPHAGHAAMPPADATPVNSICAICGMAVNPKLPTAVYQGKVIGFGCKTCPPQFAKNPDRYGPAALKNQVVEE